MFRPRYESAKADFIIPPERGMFRILMKAFAAKFVTCLDGEWVHPSYLFKVYLLNFAVALIQYKSQHFAKDTCTVEDLTAAVTGHFNKDHADLAAALVMARKSEVRVPIVWNGPTITIAKRKDKEQEWAAKGTKERREWSGQRIYF